MSTKLSYSAEEKRSIVETYLQGKTSQQDLAERYGTGKSTIQNWLRLYQTFGLEGLSRQKHTTRYSPELKLSVVRPTYPDKEACGSSVVDIASVQTDSYSTGLRSIMNIRKVPQSRRVLNNGRKETS